MLIRENELLTFIDYGILGGSGTIPGAISVGKISWTYPARIISQTTLLALSSSFLSKKLLASIIRGTTFLSNMFVMTGTASATGAPSPGATIKVWWQESTGRSSGRNLHRISQSSHINFAMRKRARSPKFACSIYQFSTLHNTFLKELALNCFVVRIRSGNGRLHLHIAKILLCHVRWKNLFHILIISFISKIHR